MVLSLNERRACCFALELALKAAVSNSDKDDCMMAVIAEKNGFNINTFRSSINPTTPTHKAEYLSFGSHSFRNQRCSNYGQYLCNSWKCSLV
jgi:hypothetical protein